MATLKRRCEVRCRQVGEASLILEVSLILETEATFVLSSRTHFLQACQRSCRGKMTVAASCACWLQLSSASLINFTSTDGH